MKNLKIVIVSVILLATLACQQNDVLSINPDVQFKKDRTLRTASIDLTSASDQVTINTAMETIYYHRQQKRYWGTFLYMPSNNSTFYFDNGSITPPASIQYGKDFDLTFSLRKDTVTNELVYTFDPHGCTFDPPAELILDYKELGTDFPQLYYIEDDGSYTEQTPDHIDIQNRWITIYINHFSRYAVAYGR